MPAKTDSGLTPPIQLCRRWIGGTSSSRVPLLACRRSLSVLPRDCAPIPIFIRAAQTSCVVEISWKLSEAFESRNAGASDASCPQHDVKGRVPPSVIRRIKIPSAIDSMPPSESELPPLIELLGV